MDGRAEIGLGACHHPAVNDNDVQRSEIGLGALTQILLHSWQRMNGKVGKQFSAARGGFSFLRLVDLADMGGKARITEQIAEDVVGSKAR